MLLGEVLTGVESLSTLEDIAIKGLAILSDKRHRVIRWDHRESAVQRLARSQKSIEEVHDMFANSRHCAPHRCRG